MKQNRIIQKTVNTLSGKYGILLLTALNFGLTLLVITLSKNWERVQISFIQEEFLTLYLLDYRVGFVSRAFVGSIFALFTDHPTLKMVRAIVIVVFFLSILLLSFFQAKLTKKALLTSNYAVLFLSCLHCLNVLCWEGVFENVGLLDIFTYALLLLYSLSIKPENRLKYYLAPFTCCFGLLIHTTFFFACFPVIVALLWFDLFQQPKADRLRITLFSATCMISVGLFILFVFFPDRTVRMDWDECLALMRQKYSGTIWDEYVQFYLYGQHNDYIVRNGKDLIQYLHENTHRYKPIKIIYSIYLSPIVALFAWGCINGVRKSNIRKSSKRNLAYLGLIVPLLALFPEMYVSPDECRFFSPFLISQFLMLYYLFMYVDGFYLPSSISAPKKRMSLYKQSLRQKRVQYVWVAIIAVSIVYISWGFRFPL